MYALPSAADMLALDLGEHDFFQLDRVGNAAADGAITASATSFNLKSITPNNAVDNLHYLESASGELIRIISSTDLTLTTAQVTEAQRGRFGTVASAYADSAPFLIRSNLKTALLQIATQDIVAYHQQVCVGSLWYSGSELLKRACVLQAIFLSRTIEARHIADFIRSASESNYSDTVISVGRAAGNTLSQHARVLVDEALIRSGMAIGEYQRA